MKTSQSIKTITLLIFMALGSSVVFNSCKDDDPCDDQICLNGGTCNDGNCNCPVAFEDQNCGTETRSKFIATYNCTNTCFSGVSYSQFITKSSTDAAKFIINNVGNEDGLNVVGRVTGGNLFVVDNQNVTDGFGDSWTISGNGTLNGNIITATMSYTYNPSGASLTCNESWTKQ